MIRTRCPRWAAAILYLLTAAAIAFCGWLSFGAGADPAGSPIPAAVITLLCAGLLCAGLCLRLRFLVGLAALWSCVFVGLLLAALPFMITPAFILALLALQLHIALLPSFQGLGVLGLPALAVSLLASTTAVVLFFDTARYEKTCDGRRREHP